MNLLLNKETQQCRERIFTKDKSLGEKDETLYLLFNKIPSQEIQNLSYDKRLSWLRIQTSSSSEVTLSNSSVTSSHNSNNKIGVTIPTKEKLNVKLENQLLKLIRSEFKEQYYPHHFSKLRFID